MTGDKAHVLFAHLGEVAIGDIVDAFYAMDIEPGTHIIRQGDSGDRFYLVVNGSFDIFVSRKEFDSETMSPPMKVTSVGPGGSFGELALMYNSPRAATVVSTLRAEVFALDREAFQMLVVQARTHLFEMYEGWLSTVPLLKSLNSYELAKLSDLLENELYSEGDVIIQEGDVGDKFYILERGELEVFVGLEDGREQQVNSYSSPGDYFGEVALLDSQNLRRKATVKAKKDSSVYWVTKEDFHSVVGPVKRSLETGMSQYFRPSDAAMK